MVLGIDAHRLKVNVAGRDQVRAALLVPLCQVLIVLEVIGVQLVRRSMLSLGLYVIAELHDLHRVAHLFKIRLDVLDDLRMRRDGSRRSPVTSHHRKLDATAGSGLRIRTSASAPLNSFFMFIFLSFFSYLSFTS